MGSVSGDEESPFFDAQEINAPSISEPNCDCMEAAFDSHPRFNNWVDGSLVYDVWNRSPMSVHERRRKFLKWMGMGLDRTPPYHTNSLSLCSDWREGDGGRLMDNSGVESSDFEDVFVSGDLPSHVGLLMILNFQRWLHPVPFCTGMMGLRENVAGKMGI